MARIGPQRAAVFAARAPHLAVRAGRRPGIACCRRQRPGGFTCVDGCPAQAPCPPDLNTSIASCSMCIDESAFSASFGFRLFSWRVRVLL